MKIPKREEGQGLVEYALVLVLVAVVIIAILTILGSSVMVVYARVIGGLNGQVVTGQGTEVVVTSYDADIEYGAACNVTVSDVSVIVLRDGAIYTSPVTVRILVDGVQRASGSVTPDSSGRGILPGPFSNLSGTQCKITFAAQ
jgi:pilus assembly protein Flp/PilA